MQFPTKLTRVRQPHRHNRMTSDSDGLASQPAEMLVIERGIGTGGKHIAGVWPIQGKRRPGVRQNRDISIFILFVLSHMIHQTLFKKGSTDKIITVFFVSEDRGFKFNSAAPVQHMTQSDATNLCR